MHPAANRASVQAPAAVDDAELHPPDQRRPRRLGRRELDFGLARRAAVRAPDTTMPPSTRTCIRLEISASLISGKPWNIRGMKRFPDSE